jgi:uncharacterized protein YjbI with pentapeptide repeats
MTDDPQPSASPVPWAGRIIRAVSFAGQDLRGIDLRQCRLHNVDLRGADLRGALLDGAVLDSCVLTGATMDHASLTGTVVRRSNLDDVRLDESVLDDVVFQLSSLRRSSFDGAALRDVKMLHCGLAFAELENIVIAGDVVIVGNDDGRSLKPDLDPWQSSSLRDRVVALIDADADSLRALALGLGPRSDLRNDVAALQNHVVHPDAVERVDTAVRTLNAGLAKLSAAATTLRQFTGEEDIGDTIEALTVEADMLSNSVLLVGDSTRLGRPEDPVPPTVASQVDRLLASTPRWTDLCARIHSSSVTPLLMHRLAENDRRFLGAVQNGWADVETALTEFRTLTMSRAELHMRTTELRQVERIEGLAIAYEEGTSNAAVDVALSDGHPAPTFSGRQLPWSSFRNARLPRGSDFSFTDLRNADLRQLRGRSLHFRHADMSGARCDGASLRGADLRGVRAVGTGLDGADLTDALVDGADFTGVDFSAAEIAGIDFRSADLGRARFHPSQLDQVIMTPRQTATIVTGSRRLGGGVSLERPHARTRRTSRISTAASHDTTPTMRPTGSVPQLPPAGPEAPEDRTPRPQRPTGPSDGPSLSL